MAEAKTIARPYAEAAFALAREQKSLAAWSDMLALVAAVAGDGQVLRLATDPRVSHDQLLSLFLAVCGDRLNREGQNLARTLVENRRLAVLPEIVEVFEELKNVAEAHIEATVQSAFPMSPEQVRALEQGLARKLARTVTVKVMVDPALIGGTLVRAGDLVIDASVRGRLEQLAATLNS
ncbi:MAG: ATP synthase F1 subunit delta [Candidatus Muproteobacteria bacterium RBG_16_64_10]|uniref:ATP synthase subunit delta n=1 Tax=Candidatus Muproteobacteria bacterium RBG_16_64_10 TaxID=1817757 RepID=A0A1F6SXH3_9PROT|nr:MAG: ATP synthase F1 subunit delta [Candidatus Muproteobacteria bacterium RBG_16_64_10]